MICTLTSDEVLAIHHVLAADFAADDDPISPAGIKSIALLDSAISRQFTGFGSTLKYDTPIKNAASLTYGICSNHPFHNGNKRTSLVALLCHLDKNDLTFEDSLSHVELYDFMLKVASHGFADRAGKADDQSDVEVEQMAKWIRKRVRRVERGERIVTFRELKGILSTYGLILEDLRDNHVDVVRYEDRSTWFGLKTKRERTRLMRMQYPSDGQVVGKELLRDLRKRCNLTQEDGVDSHSFYRKSRPTDYFIRNYRGTLKKLARV
jgi:death-on-curing protein